MSKTKNYARGAESTVSDGFEAVDPATPEEKTTTALATTVEPDFFESVGEGLARPSAFAKVPWIGFFGSKTKAGREALVSAGVEENQFYLYDEAGPLKVKPFSYHLLRAARYYTKQDKDGKVVAATKSNPYDTDKATKFREHIIALVVVAKKDTMGGYDLVPATWSLRSGLIKALRKGIDLISSGGAAFNKDAWAARSAAHAISAQARFPGGRFVLTAWGTSESTKADDGEESFDYNLGHCAIAPTSAEGVAAFNQLATVDFASRLAPAVSSWDWRCKQLDKLVR